MHKTKLTSPQVFPPRSFPLFTKEHCLGARAGAANTHHNFIGAHALSVKDPAGPALLQEMLLRVVTTGVVSMPPTPKADHVNTREMKPQKFGSCW